MNLSIFSFYYVKRQDFIQHFFNGFLWSRYGARIGAGAETGTLTCQKSEVGTGTVTVTCQKSDWNQNHKK
jgi:hypothetical protein